MPLLNNSYSLTALTVITVLLASRFINKIEGSVHIYEGDKFSKKGNAFVVHGGSEGIYYSHLNPFNSNKSSNGDAFIRYLFNLF